MSRLHGTKISEQIALQNAGDLFNLTADKDYDWMALRKKLREESMRPLIKH